MSPRQSPRGCAQPAVMGLNFCPAKDALRGAENHAARTAAWFSGLPLPEVQAVLSAGGLGRFQRFVQMCFFKTSFEISRNTYFNETSRYRLVI